MCREKKLKLWYKKEAKEWTEALPIGNGHMGAMGYGDKTGRFDLSEGTCWSGGLQSKYIDDNAAKYMKEARELFIQSKLEQGEELIKRCIGIKENYGTQLPLGKLWIGIEDDNNIEIKYRSLDLRNGVCEDRFLYDEKEIIRTSFISAVDKVMVVRLKAVEGSLPHTRIWLEGFSGPNHTKYEEKKLFLKGRALENIHSNGLEGVQYQGNMSILTEGKASLVRDGVVISQANEVIIILATATDMFNDNIEKICETCLEQAEKKGWEKLYKDHCKEHESWMSKCNLELESKENLDLPTDERIKRYKHNVKDNELVSLFFQYGRYMLLSSSRPDSKLPAALQGIFNDNRAARMAWTNDMHLDINTQMNYFPAEATGLGECCQPLFEWIDKILVPQGHQIAKQLYGSEGWCAHTVSNAWGWAAPGWGHGWGYHVSGGAWIATHLWNHYLYNEDKQFLSKVYPILKESARYLYDLLMLETESGYLVTVPSYSPENGYYDEEGKVHYLTVGATVDNTITKYIFDIILKASEVLNEKCKLINKLKEVQHSLRPFEIGKYGELKEWHKEFKELNADHRHTSHLLALYPFNYIDIEETPELAEAVKISLKRRLGENAEDIIFANWAGALLIIYYARLHDGEVAGKFLKSMINNLSRENLMITHAGKTTSVAGGIYELDGNTGLTTGILEMLIHTHKGEINVLPAIPSFLEKGRIDGLIAQGGHSVEIHWENHLLKKVFVTAAYEGDILIRYKNIKKSCGYNKGETKSFSYIDNKLVEDIGN